MRYNDDASDNRQMANGMTSPGCLAVQFMRQIYELFSAFLRRIIAFFSACLYGCLSYVFIYRNLYNLPCPQVGEEFFDRKNLNIVFPPLIHIIRDDYKSSVWIVLAKGAKPPSVDCPSPHWWILFQCPQPHHPEQHLSPHLCLFSNRRARFDGPGSQDRPLSLV